MRGFVAWNVSLDAQRLIRSEESRPIWSEQTNGSIYLEAARRNVEIARDALSELKRVLPQTSSIDPLHAPNKPAVSVQRNLKAS
jgi:hypothetical protein